MDIKQTDRKRLVRILGYLVRHRVRFMLGFFVTILFGLTETLLPWIMSLLLDAEKYERWIPQEKMPVVLPLMLIGLFAVRGILGFCRTYWREWLHHTMARDLRRELAAKLVSLPKTYHDRETSGVLLARMTQFIEQMLNSSITMIVGVLQDSVRLIGYLATVFVIDWRFTLVAITALPITAVMITLINRRVRRFAEHQTSAVRNLAGSFGDTIQGHTVVKTYGGQQRELNRLESDLTRVRGAGLRQGVALALNQPFSQLFLAIAISLILGLLAAALQAGTLSNGEVATFITTLLLVPLPVRNLVRLSENVQISLAASTQVFELLDTDIEVSGGNHAPELIKGKLEFVNVNFAYGTEDTAEVLSDINLVIEPGERVALVGPSGGGKSTLTSLLLAFYRPNAGVIKVDDVNINQWSLSALRAGIGVVTQDVILFNATVAENVAYPYVGDEIDAKRLRAALVAAQAQDFVAQMPDGSATMLGERGLDISGGQRQRLSIARAFYKDAPILILDEATSALDANTEDALHGALQKLLENRTALVISHRLATLKLVNRIALVEAGRLVGVGTHKQLLEGNSLYRSLYESQRLTK